MKRLAYKFRLKPSPEQQQKMHQFAGCARYVYNFVLALEKASYATIKKLMGYKEGAKHLVQLKKSAETSFLKDVHSQILQQKIMDLYKGYNNFFLGHAALPRFKKKGINDNFRYPQGFKIDEQRKRIYLPKIGWVAYYQSRMITGTPKNITISYSAGSWFCSIQTEQELVPVVHPSNSRVGIDLGITRFATLSDGTFIEPINSMRRHEKRLKKAQRILARKTRGSRNRLKAIRKVAKIHVRIGNVRRDFLHKTTTTISKNHAMVVMEDLKICNMSKSARGTKEEPGKQVAAKSGLNKSILDQGWHEFKRQLEYKLLWAGGKLVLIPPQHTSQKCSCCGYVDKDNRKTQSAFVCLQCGYCANADYNASINILAAGHAVLACGEMPLGTQ